MNIPLFFILFGLPFALIGAHFIFSGLTPVEIDCSFPDGWAARCSITGPAFPFKTKTREARSISGVEIKAVRGSKSSTYKLRFITADGGGYDIESASSNAGMRQRREAEGELRTLLTRGRALTFSYKPGGMVLFGSVFLAVGLVVLLIGLWGAAGGGRSPRTIRFFSTALDNMSAKVSAEEEEFLRKKRNADLMAQHPEMQRKINTIKKIMFLPMLVFLVFFVYMAFKLGHGIFDAARQPAPAQTVRAETPAVPQKRNAEKKIYYFYMTDYPDISQRTIDTLAEWSDIYKTSFALEYIGTADNTAYFETIPMTEEEKEDFLKYMGNRSDFYIGGPAHADLGGAAWDAHIQRNALISLNMGEASSYILEAAAEAGDPEMKNSRIVSDYYEIKDLKISVNKNGEVVLDVYFPDLNTASDFRRSVMLGNPIRNKGITDVLPEVFRG